MRRLLLGIVFMMLGFSASGQKMSVSTNVLDWASLGTVNVEGSYAVGRHWTTHVEWDYNPWTYREGTDEQFQNRHLSGEIGTRWWPWHVYSGWWFSGCLKYEIYNRGGLTDGSAEEGDAYGMGLSAGYAYMISDRINIDFGLGLWGGHKKYTVYRCTNCGRIMEQGEKGFLQPHDFMISFVYVF